MSSFSWFLGYQQTPASTSGAIDAVAIRKSDGQILRCSPFHVKLPLSGQAGAKNTNSDVQTNKTVLLRVNGKGTKVAMKLGQAGEAFFIHKISKLNHRHHRHRHDASLSLRGDHTRHRRLKKNKKHGQQQHAAPVVSRAEDRQHGATDSAVASSNINTASTTTTLKLNSKTDNEVTEADRAIISTAAAVETESRSSSFWIWSWGALPTNKSEKSLDKLLTSDLTEPFPPVVSVTSSASLLQLGVAGCDTESNWSTSVVVSPDLPEFSPAPTAFEDGTDIASNRHSRSAFSSGSTLLSAAESGGFQLPVPDFTSASNVFMEAGQVPLMSPLEAPPSPPPVAAGATVPLPLSLPHPLADSDSDASSSSSSDGCELINVQPGEICPGPAVGDLLGHARSFSSSRRSSRSSDGVGGVGGNADSASVPRRSASPHLPPPPLRLPMSVGTGANTGATVVNAVNISTVSASYLGIGDDDDNQEERGSVSGYDYDSNNSNSYNSNSACNSDANSTLSMDSSSVASHSHSHSHGRRRGHGLSRTSSTMSSSNLGNNNSSDSNSDSDSSNDDSSSMFYNRSRSSSFDSMSSSSYDCRNNSYYVRSSSNSRDSASGDEWGLPSRASSTDASSGSSGGDSAGSLRSCPTTSESIVPTLRYRYRKSLFPSAKQLQRMGLCAGKNDICFELASPPVTISERESKGGAGGGALVVAAAGTTKGVTAETPQPPPSLSSKGDTASSTATIATTPVSMTNSGSSSSKDNSKIPQLKLYLFVWSELRCRIVIVNLDGAVITRRRAVTTNSLIGSLFLGVVGGNSASVIKHDVVEGAVELLHKLAANGYSLLYIASNAVAAMISRSTDYSINVNGIGSGACLPFGPIIQPPDALMSTSANSGGSSAAASFGASLMTESASYVFKATALQGIKNLFPEDHNPFYAAFGASQCDLMAFSRCEIPEGRIYMIQEVQQQQQQQQQQRAASSATTTGTAGAVNNNSGNSTKIGGDGGSVGGSNSNSGGGSSKLVPSTSATATAMTASGGGGGGDSGTAKSLSSGSFSSSSSGASSSSSSLGNGTASLKASPHQQQQHQQQQQQQQPRHCLYNVNHCNYKMSFADISTEEEQLFNRFPRVEMGEEEEGMGGSRRMLIVSSHTTVSPGDYLNLNSTITSLPTSRTNTNPNTNPNTSTNNATTTTTTTTISANNSFLARGDDSYSTINYWKMPIPLID